MSRKSPVYFQNPDGSTSFELTPAGMLMGMLSTIPGFRDHGDGTWSVGMRPPKRFSKRGLAAELRRRKKPDVTLAMKRRGRKGVATLIVATNFFAGHGR
jgi:hypothetical protein